MPKFKSVLTGLALSTAAAGSIIGLGGLTAAEANAASVSTGTSVLQWCGSRCGGWGGGGGWHRRGRGVRVHIHLHNRNHNNNIIHPAHNTNTNFNRPDRERERHENPVVIVEPRERDHHHWGPGYSGGSFAAPAPVVDTP